MLKVLFVASCKRDQKVGPIIFNQGESVASKEIAVDYFAVNGKGIGAYFKSISILRNYLKNNEQDLIHAHYGLSGLVSLLARRKEKLVVSFMGDDIFGSNKPDGSITFISRVLARINILFSKYFYDYSIVKSQEMFEKLGKSKYVSLIPNGVDVKHFTYKNYYEAYLHTGFVNGKKHIIFVSDPKRVEKNYPLAEASVKYLNDSDLILHTISDVQNDSLVNYYNAADLLLMTSFHEGSPNVIKEAMACNCPVVSTDVGDVKWLFDKTPGYYIASYDPVDIAGKIMEAMEFRKKYRQTLGQNRLFELELNSDTVALRIVDLYKKVISGNNH